MRYILGLLAILAFCSLSGFPVAQAQDDCRTQLWGDAKITPPAADVPEELRRWSGLYGNGRWNRTLCNSIAVLSVDKNGSAKVQYAWGTAPTWGIYRAGFDVYPAKINGDSLSFAIPSFGVNVVYTRIGDRLHGTWTSALGVFRTTLTEPSVELTMRFSTSIDPLDPSAPAHCARFHGVWGKGTWRSGRAYEVWVSVHADCTASVWEVTSKTPGQTIDFWVAGPKKTMIAESFVLPGGNNTQNTFEMRDGKLIATSRNASGAVVSETTPLEKLGM